MAQQQQQQQQQQQRQFQMEEGLGNETASFNDTKLTKIFVGGLAWETQRETMRRYFEQFGEIIEAVVITDKNTGRSKGYGFVTFKEPEAAMRACQNMSPVIDGRRANCNLACLGAQKPRPPTSPRHGTVRFRSGTGAGGAGLVAPSPSQAHQFRGSFIHQPTAQFPFPYSPYGFSGYSQEGIYSMNYYNQIYGGQQYSAYMSPSGSSGMFHGFYPYYGQFGAQSSSQTHHQQQHQSFSVHQYTAPPPPPPLPLLQYPYLPHHHHHQHFTSQPSPPPLLSLPTSFALSSSSSSAVATTSGAGTTMAAAVTSSSQSIATTGGEAISSKDVTDSVEKQVIITTT